MNSNDDVGEDKERFLKGKVMVWVSAISAGERSSAGSLFLLLICFPLYAYPRLYNANNKSPLKTFGQDHGINISFVVGNWN